MEQTRCSPDRRLFRWAVVVSVMAAATLFLTPAAIAGPKGIVIARPLGNLKITIDGDISDWPLDKFTMAAQQPLFPMAQTMASTTAMGDHIVFDANRVGLFLSTPAGAFPNGPNAFGASTYFAYDASFLYVLHVAIDPVIRDDRDTTQYGSSIYMNDGFELFLDPKGDSTGCFSDDGNTINPVAPYTDDLQIQIALDANFKPQGAADNVLGAVQNVVRAGTPAVLGDSEGAPGGIYRDLLDSLSGPNIAARRYADLRAAGARNPELAANPTLKFSGYVIEMRMPFSPKIAGFSPDHNMGFDLFWRDVDMDNDPNAGAANVKWADWAQSTTVDCSSGDATTLMLALFNTDNWGTLVFDKTDFLGSAPQ